MLDYLKKISTLFLAASILIVVFFPNFAQASIWDVIKAWVTINPLEINVSAPAEVEIGKVFKVEARVINKGEEKVENARGEIFLPAGLILLKEDSVQEIGIIPGKKEKKISWQVRGEEIGSYVISVSASGELKGYIVSGEGSTLVKVGEPLPRGRGWGWLQNLFDLFRERFRF